MLGREGKAGSSGRAGETGVRNNKNNTIEASMLLKTNEGVCKTKLKRTPNEPQLSAEIRASRVEFELSSSRLVLIRLFQQATTCSIWAWRALCFRKPCTSSS
jgi:hypothetical protein